MKQKLLIILVLGFLIALLAVLNAATYVQKEKVPDTEFAPNRSTYNPGSTGTQAFYTLLYETGRKVTRWQSSLETIASETRNRPAVFVIIGPLREALTDVETTQLMRWVSSGGTLVIIDREPSTELAMTTTQWQISVSPVVSPELFTVDASDQKQMTASTAAHKPVLPSFLSYGVNAVQPSRFASSVELTRFTDIQVSERERRTVTGMPAPSPTPYDLYSNDPLESDTGDPTLEVPANDESGPIRADEDTLSFDAPAVHVAGAGRNLLVEAPFAQGRVIVLTDPYIVSNAGIGLVDNARLGVNIVTSREGVIAFDEYHHGYGANTNRFFQYFEGTPVIAIFLQCGLLVGLIFVSQSRRFARPVPEREQSRLSKLEYVSAMAELQQRTKAYDLAVENIYSDFRRRVCALVGLDNTVATRRAVAERLAPRIASEPGDVEQLLRVCEDIIHGEPAGRKQTVEVVARIRKIEELLGLQRSSGRKGK